LRLCHAISLLVCNIARNKFNNTFEADIENYALNLLYLGRASERRNVGI
jgi:hypothetical protein